MGHGRDDLRLRIVFCMVMGSHGMVDPNRDLSVGHKIGRASHHSVHQHVLHICDRTDLSFNVVRIQVGRLHLLRGMGGGHDGFHLLVHPGDEGHSYRRDGVRVDWTLVLETLRSRIVQQRPSTNACNHGYQHGDGAMTNYSLHISVELIETCCDCASCPVVCSWVLCNSSMHGHPCYHILIVLCFTGKWFCQRYNWDLCYVSAFSSLMITLLFLWVLPDEWNSRKRLRIETWNDVVSNMSWSCLARSTRSLDYVTDSMMCLLVLRNAGDDFVS